MIRFDNISKIIEGEVVLEDVGGHFEPGKVNLIIGASGTGKSVLLKCLVGLMLPDSGNVFFDGVDFWQGSRAEQVAIKQTIGMLFQGGALFDSKNVEENILFPLNILTTLPYDEKLDRVNACLKCVGLINMNKKMPSELSGGMQKRVGVARAIVNNPKYLFCDEPTSGLDARTGTLIDELIKDITCEYRMTTVIVTHDLNTTLSMGDHILFLEQGKKVWEGEKKELLTTKNTSLHHFLFSSKLMQLVKQQMAANP